MKTIGLASDHAGFDIKEYAKHWLVEHGYEVKDFGTYSKESCDYPDFAHMLAESVEAGECQAGVAVCATGEGISMTLNKHQGIRAALCWRPDVTRLARGHNDANILVLPGKYVNGEEASQILETFFSSEFEGGRHLRRILKIPVKH